jgi:hypothetical protein
MANILGRRSSFRLAFAQESYFKSVAPLYEIGKTLGLGLIRKLWTVAWDQWEHRNSILHERDSTKQHTLITQETDRLITWQFAMGMQGASSNNHYLFQEAIEELLKAQLYVREQWLASTQSARERQAEINFSKGLGKT